MRLSAETQALAQVTYPMETQDDLVSQVVTSYMDCASEGRLGYSLSLVKSARSRRSVVNLEPVS
jgi:hypothetical protein